jgi:hypothetical protein
MEHSNIKVLIQSGAAHYRRRGCGHCVDRQSASHPEANRSRYHSRVQRLKIHQARYIESLRLTYELLNKARLQWLMSLETDIEDPTRAQSSQRTLSS